MKPSEMLPRYRDTMRQMVLDAGMENPRLFGSIIHGDDIEESDIDILIDAPGSASLFDLARLQLDLEAKTPFKIDLLVAGSLHPYFRDDVLSEAVPL